MVKVPKPKAKTVAKKPAVRATAKAKPKAKPQAKPARKPQAPSPSPAVAASKPKPPQIGRDWSATLFLPKTDFPMKAGLPEREPELLKRWERLRLYDRLREEAMGREKFILHDGPPYANGHLHIGHALNKILKDVINRSQGMMGKDANYVPGWDCHGLPIEWKIEEENYRAKGKTKPDLSDPAAMIAFRRECRAYAQHWLDVQRAEFKRLGVEGDWDHPYTTMSFDAEATIAAELMKFAMNGTLYRGSKPVMWSVVEKTALAEAEVEYQEVTSTHDLREVSSRAAGGTGQCGSRWRRRRQADGSGNRFFRRQGEDARRRERGHLDHHALDYSGQSRHRVFARHRLRTLRGNRRACRQLGQARR